MNPAQPQGRGLLEGGRSPASCAAAITALRRALAAHNPSGEREAASLSRCKVAAGREGDPFDRHGDPTHFTASAIVVGEGRTALHLHKRLRRWLQPGGHIDPGELAWDAAMREAAEETGLELRHPEGGPLLVHVDVHQAGGHEHLDLRYLLVGSGEPAPQVGESTVVRWFGWPDALRVASDAGLMAALALSWRWQRRGG